MNYFFILGSNPTLSTAELASIFGLKKDLKYSLGRLITDNVFILETDKEINAGELIRKIGGTIKIGIINPSNSAGKREALQFGGQAGIKNYDGIKNSIIEMLKDEQPEGKFKFGISYYGKTKFNIKPLAMEIKNYLRGRNVNSRWVTSREPTLSSVVVEQNKLIPPAGGQAGKGVEIVLIESGDEILIGRTLAVQPFKELSFRDYGRPARDDYSGMLPPKLAQIMINLAALPPFARGVGGIAPLRKGGLGGLINLSLLDPFCGSGTILTEAMLMGCKNPIGSDISPKAIDDTKKNIEWIIKNYELRIKNYELHNANATEISKFIKPNSIDAIVTEPYLGPQRGRIDIKKTVHELEQLYAKSLIEFKKVLKKDGRAVMAWPVFMKREANGMKQIRINPNLNGFKIINPIPDYLRGDKKQRLTDRNTIIYGREGQKVWREIVLLY